jgi:CRP-like cAMP-binding protein
MAFLDHRQRSADTIAKTDCDLYVLSRKEFNQQVYIDSVLGVRIFARIARAISLRLRQTDIELSAMEER